MTIELPVRRVLGCMVAVGFAEVDLDADLALAKRLGAQMVEVFPHWRSLPDPAALGARARDAGLTVHSAHGCWGGQTIRASRVDLGHLDESTHRESVEDLKRCIDWLQEAGGNHLVVHPGGLSDRSDRAARRATLARGLIALAEHAHATDVVVCVENMPPGVEPGSRMGDLTSLLDELGQARLALAIDTGHANISADAADETFTAGRWLRSTHVHDNDGRQDSHEIPGFGTVDWNAWAAALDAVGYTGPIVLECVRQLRKHPDQINERFRQIIARLMQMDGPSAS
jgi:sugar phosphate isomerase/epimerase